MLKEIMSLTSFLLAASAMAHQVHPHYAEVPKRANGALIKITINPEARVSVAIVGTIPQAVPCGKAMDLPVFIANQGFLTVPLHADLVVPSPKSVGLEFSKEPLKGLPEERTLRIMLRKPGSLDITVAFRANGDVGDLGGRDRFHMLVGCEVPPIQAG